MYRLLTVLAFLVGLFGGVSALAQTMDHGALHVAHGWARASLGQNPNSAAYVTIHNPTKTGDRVISLSCEAAVRCEIHNHVMDDGVMKMRRVENLVVEAGAHVEFGPGKLHIMMFDLEAPLIAGEKTRISITFEKSGTVATEVQVLTLRDAAERGKKSAHEGHKSSESDEHRP